MTIMYTPISNEALYILGCLSHVAMTVQQLSEYRNFTSNLEWAEVNPEGIYREMQLLQRRGLIKWIRNPGDTKRIYHITETGRQFLRDYLLIEINSLLEEHREFTLVVNALDILDKSKQRQITNRRRVFVNKIIRKIKKTQALLDKRERTRQLLLQYYLYRFQGELRWLEDIIGSQGSQNDQT
ncbi:MAG: hypothetical protein JETCAE01_26260 [Anaerolineaceae bacterium]|nr:MAG: hypothetical protein JETCAE01_26260 [Anaerolineaceae bacterium]